MIQRIVRKALWGLFFFAFFEKFFVPILTSGGYVGLSIATLLSQHHRVTAVDIVPEKVKLINNRKSPIQDLVTEHTRRKNEIFYRFGLIDVSDEAKEKMKKSFSKSS